MQIDNVGEGGGWTVQERMLSMELGFGATMTLFTQYTTEVEPFVNGGVREEQLNSV